MLAGGATFRNSFSQRSNYAYLGKRFDSDSYPVYLKLTGGLLQGYRGEYRDKIPLNRFGVAPAIIPRWAFASARWAASWCCWAIRRR